MSTSRRRRDTGPSSRVRALHEQGVSVWLDDLSRALLESGTLERYVRVHALSGVTSNHTIFANAVRSDDRYRDRLAGLVDQGLREPHVLFFALALADVHDAAGLMYDTYERSGGRDDSTSPSSAPRRGTRCDRHGPSGAARHGARRGPQRDDQGAGHRRGIEAVEELTAEGINVNVTLLFGASRYEQAARAYQLGIERRARAGEPVERVRSVASVFVSRVDALVA